jgi:hypothetical protein
MDNHHLLMVQVEHMLTNTSPVMPVHHEQQPGFLIEHQKVEDCKLFSHLGLKGNPQTEIIMRSKSV